MIPLLCLLLIAVPWVAEAGGSVSGQVLAKGGGTKPKRLSVTIDRQVCGDEQFSESLIVGKKGEVRNAAVFVKGPVEGGKRPASGNYSIDRRGCRFRPHVLLVPAGNPVRVLNSDGIFHNFRTESRLNPPMSRSEAGGTPPFELRFTRPEIFRCSSDLHPFMEGWVVVQEHSYYALTGGDGRYELTDLPAGVYTLRAWHETLGEAERKIQVLEGEKTVADFMLGGLK